MNGTLQDLSVWLFRKNGSKNAELDKMKDAEPIRIFGWSGSLRKNSFDRSILSAALEMVPEDAALEVFDLEGMSLFNPDLRDGPPEKVKVFKEKIRAADAILVATPESTFSIPGVLQNAIDWASRPSGENALDGKPVAIMGAIMGASPGGRGAARPQYYLRQTFASLNMSVLETPEVVVSFANEKVDPKGRLIDRETRENIKELVESLVSWTRKMRNNEPVARKNGTYGGK